MIETRRAKQEGVTEIYPDFIIKKTKDLMIRGGDFYAIWVEERGLWSTDENDALEMIDRTVRGTVREQMRILVKRILRRHGYPPDKRARATELVLEQAEVICRDWADPH